MIKADELAAAAAAADQGPPVHPWAVLLELAGVGGLSKMPAPKNITFFDNPDLGPGLALDFYGQPFEAAAAWIRWFGREPEKTLNGYPTHKVIRWRGYDVSINGEAQAAER